MGLHRRLAATLGAIIVLCLVSLQVVHIPLFSPRVTTLSCASTKGPSSSTVFKKEEAMILVSYAFWEKDATQRDNFDFFMKVGMAPHEKLEYISFVFVIAPGPCSACSKWSGSQPVDVHLREAGIAQIGFVDGATILYRSENEGMDLASHNVSIEYLKRTDRYKNYLYFILLNSSTKGPYYPHYMPDSWHWTDAFLTLFKDRVHAVAASLVCLPIVDAGGPGPRLESWAVAIDTVGLELLLREQVFNIRTCKLCSDGEGIVVGGEYGMTAAMLKEGYNVATFMTKYAKGIDWGDLRHWSCNDNVHPSRDGTYEGISFHPFETLFVKSSWHVSDVWTSKYSKWELAHLSGDPGTSGQYDEARYHYAISMEAQQENPMDRIFV